MRISKKFYNCFLQNNNNLLIIKMKYCTILALVACSMLIGQNNQVQGVKLSINENKLDDTTKESVKKAAAAALKVAVAAKKAEAAESIKRDQAEVVKAERRENSDNIIEALEKVQKQEEKKAVEAAVAVVEKIRQKKLQQHDLAMKEIEQIKSDAQKKHDEINKATLEATQKTIAKAQAGLLVTDKKTA